MLVSIEEHLKEYSFSMWQVIWFNKTPLMEHKNFLQDMLVAESLKPYPVISGYKSNIFC
jgi:hypothetical protein